MLFQTLKTLTREVDHLQTPIYWRFSMQATIRPRFRHNRALMFLSTLYDVRNLGHYVELQKNYRKRSRGTARSRNYEPGAIAGFFGDIHFSVSRSEILAGWRDSQILLLSFSYDHHDSIRPVNLHPTPEIVWRNHGPRINVQFMPSSHEIKWSMSIASATWVFNTSPLDSLLNLNSSM